MEGKRENKNRVKYEISVLTSILLINIVYK